MDSLKLAVQVVIDYVLKQAGIRLRLESKADCQQLQARRLLLRNDHPDPEVRKDLNKTMSHNDE
jgi:hypothetical protein